MNDNTIISIDHNKKILVCSKCNNKAIALRTASPALRSKGESHVSVCCDAKLKLRSELTKLEASND